MPAAAVDGGLQIDLADTLQDADKEGVDGDQSASVWRLDMAFAVFEAEPLEQSDLFIGQSELVFGGGLLQPQQPIVLGQPAVALPDPAHAAGGGLDAEQHQLLGNRIGS